MIKRIVVEFSDTIAPPEEEIKTNRLQTSIKSESGVGIKKQGRLLRFGRV